MEGIRFMFVMLIEFEEGLCVVKGKGDSFRRGGMRIRPGMIHLERRKG